MCLDLFLFYVSLFYNAVLHTTAMSFYSSYSVILGSISWNPSRIAFYTPFLHQPIYWYSICFAIGLMGGYLIALRVLLSCISGKESRNTLREWFDKLAIWLIFGILIGARIGHILFYDLHHYLLHPIEIVMTWQGGLSSHGGIAGVLAALLYVWHRRPAPYAISWQMLLDALALGSAWTATWIRIGNFCNQEIIGIPTRLPWGVKFGNPIDTPLIAGVACHPVQLYEATASCILLLVLFCIWKHYPKLKHGVLTGIYLITLFSLRILFEAIKMPQSDFDSNGVHMGQILSIPLLGFGLFLIISSLKK